jgi:hypothetical protein
MHTLKTGLVLIIISIATKCHHSDDGYRDEAWFGKCTNIYQRLISIKREANHAEQRRKEIQIWASEAAANNYDLRPTL